MGSITRKGQTMSTADKLVALEAAAAALPEAETRMNDTAHAAQVAAQAFASAQSRLYAAAMAYGAEQGDIDRRSNT